MRTKINLNYISDVQSFYKNVKEIDGTVLAYQGHAVIDCESLLGLFSLDLSKDIEVQYIGDNEEQFTNMVSQYVA